MCREWTRRHARLESSNGPTYYFYLYWLYIGFGSGGPVASPDKGSLVSGRVRVARIHTHDLPDTLTQGPAALVPAGQRRYRYLRRVSPYFPKQRPRVPKTHHRPSCSTITLLRHEETNHATHSRAHASRSPEPRAASHAHPHPDLAGLHSRSASPSREHEPPRRR